MAPARKAPGGALKFLKAAIVTIGLTALIGTGAVRPINSEEFKCFTPAEFKRGAKVFMPAGELMETYTGLEAKKLIEAINELAPQTQHQGNEIVVYWRPDLTVFVAAIFNDGCYVEVGIASPAFWRWALQKAREST